MCDIDILSNKINNIIELPSNRKFGYFFTIIFFIVSTYFYFKGAIIAFYISGIISIVFLLITSFKANILEPINKLWMKFGLILGKFISPIVMGTIFFLIFTPIAILMRLFGRDELLLRFKKKPSYWTKRNEDILSKSFRNQFWFMDILIELWNFLRVRKKLWLAPIIVVLVILGGLLILAQGSVVAPFIYTLF